MMLSILLILLFWIGVAVKIYGSYLAFQRSIWLGLFVLLIPFSAEAMVLYDYLQRKK